MWKGLILLVIGRAVPVACQNGAETTDIGRKPTDEETDSPGNQQLTTGRETSCKQRVRGSSHLSSTADQRPVRVTEPVFDVGPYRSNGQHQRPPGRGGDLPGDRRPAPRGHGAILVLPLAGTGSHGGDERLHHRFGYRRRGNVGGIDLGLDERTGHDGLGYVEC